MKKAFGLNCSLLILEGQADGNQDPTYFDYWNDHINSFLTVSKLVSSKVNNIPPLLSPPFGKNISRQDVTRLENFVRDFIVHNLLPFMERNIQQWKEEVKSRRRGGLTGQLLNAGQRFWGGSKTAAPQSKSYTEDSAGNYIYLAQSPEMLSRKLADYLFMTRDFASAYSIYDSVKRDFNNEKSSRYYAGIQEMLGLCVMMIDKTGKGSVEANIESAIDSYRAAQDFSYETRSCMLFYEMLKSKAQHRDAPTFLNKMTGVSLF